MWGFSMSQKKRNWFLNISLLWAVIFDFVCVFYCIYWYLAVDALSIGELQQCLGMSYHRIKYMHLILCYIQMQILHKGISLERNESGLSLDGSFVSVIEGESLADRLNSQIENDRKYRHSLKKMEMLVEDIFEP
uniref:Uncharacterized protein n=1 Tax=Davidia involucrata TaxID=16924 RepID=A0A5B7BSJ8_DAVIN